MALTEAQQAYTDRVKLVSGEYTRATRRYDKARRDYRRTPNDNTRQKLEEALTAVGRAAVAYYSRWEID